MSSWIQPLRSFLGLLFAYGGGRNPKLPKSAYKTCSLFPELGRLVISINAVSRAGRVCQGPATELWNMLPFIIAAAFISVSRYSPGQAQDRV